MAVTFFALLTKELRLRLRRERTFWVLVLYVVLLGSVGALILFNPANSGGQSLSGTGPGLFAWLAGLQIVLALFIAPAFTASAINGEKERQTFDLLLCSQLSIFSIVGGKLLAGIINALLLIAASLPVFSIVFFFGGVTLIQWLAVLCITLSTVLVVGTVGLFFSICLQRPAASTAITYVCTMLWLASPAFVAYFFFFLRFYIPSSSTSYYYIFSYNPIVSLVTVIWPQWSMNNPTWQFLPPWLINIIVNILFSALFILMSILFLLPYRNRRRKLASQNKAKEMATTLTVN